MQIILLENIIKLGKIGDLVEVKNGYGRNFLLKKGKALRASKENIETVNKKKDELNKKNNELKKEFKEKAEKINNKALTFSKEAKDSGDLFGSVKPKEISNAFIEQLKTEINPSQIELKQEIDKVGKYKVKINFHAEVSATINITINKSETS
ncbi:50S ribosomal protein L9 [Pelagibacteraceae bacterium]|nr:50S ribosomal protein L9 [Pelagibacteraceae bacterium]